MPILSAYCFLVFHTVQGPKPREWHRPQWAGSSYIDCQSRQSSADMTTGQPDLNKPSVEIFFIGHFRLW